MEFEPLARLSDIPEGGMLAVRKRTGEPLGVRLELPGGARHYDLTVEPLRTAEGAVCGVAGTALDITVWRKFVAENRVVVEGITMKMGLGDVRWTIFLNNFTLNLDLKERIENAQVIDVCATGSCNE